MVDLVDLVAGQKSYGDVPRRHVTGQQAYFLEVPGSSAAAGLSVVSFTAIEALGEPWVRSEEGTIPPLSPRVCRRRAADPDPRGGLVEEAICDQDNARQCGRQILFARRFKRKLHRKGRTTVGGDTELRKGESIVPLQEAAIRLAQSVAERRSKVAPDDQRSARLRIGDERHLEIAPSIAIERQVPGNHPIAPMFARFDAETRQQRRDRLSAQGRLHQGGTSGCRSTCRSIEARGAGADRSRCRWIRRMQ